MYKLFTLNLLIAFLSYTNFSFAESNTVSSNKAIDYKSNVSQSNQPIIVIDASKLVNPPKSTQRPSNTTSSEQAITLPSNNIRIGTSGQYIDNSKIEQMNSKGQICVSELGKKTCN